MLIPDRFSGYRAGRRLYPGMGADVQAPDPCLIDAQIKSLGIQDQAIEHMLKMSEDMAPLQRQMMQDTIDRSAVLWGQ